MENARARVPYESGLFCVDRLEWIWLNNLSFSLFQIAIKAPKITYMMRIGVPKEVKDNEFFTNKVCCAIRSQEDNAN